LAVQRLPVGHHGPWVNAKAMYQYHFCLVLSLLQNILMGHCLFFYCLCKKNTKYILN
jgi:hypothetical protein